MRTEIVFEDKSILVCYKPAGLAVQTAKVGQADMVSELKNYISRQNKRAAEYLGVVHRLDQPVEGLLVFAKDARSAADLSAQLSKSTLNKQYYAVVCGKPKEKTKELVDYLAKTSDNRAEISNEMGKKAVLKYNVLESVEAGDDAIGNFITLVDIHIDTGRFHQIRAQMSHAGFPLLGDMKYGSHMSNAISARLGVRSVALCAYGLEFVHPVTGEAIKFAIVPRGKVFGLFNRKIKE